MWTSLGDHYLAYPTYLLILLAVYFSKQSFKNSNKVHFIIFFDGLCFWYGIKKLIKPKVTYTFSGFPLYVL